MTCGRNYKRIDCGTSKQPVHAGTGGLSTEYTGILLPTIQSTMLKCID